MSCPRMGTMPKNRRARHEQQRLQASVLKMAAAVSASTGTEFFVQLAAHWKKNYAGWTAWLLTPDLKLPGKMRLKATRRVPMWNGPIECRMFRFDMVQGSARAPRDADINTS